SRGAHGGAPSKATPARNWRDGLRAVCGVGLCFTPQNTPPSARWLRCAEKPFAGSGADPIIGHLFDNAFYLFSHMSSNTSGARPSKQKQSPKSGGASTTPKKLL